MSATISWEEFLTEMITSFRREFERFTPEEQELIREKEFENLPLEPCQIEVLDFGVGKAIALLLIHDKNLPDMMFRIQKDVKSPSVSEFVSKYKYEFALLSEPRFVELLSIAGEGLAILTKKHMSMSVGSVQAREVAESFLSTAREVLRTEQVDVIERTTDGLKKSISKIPERDIRDELFATTKKIDRSLQEIRRLDEEIGKVRQLVGITKEIQDWKLLISDVDRLKGEHVPREVFDAKVNELNTRIDSLGEIKEAYDRLFAQQNQFMKQQSSLLNWVKYSMILVPIVVACVPIIEVLIRHFLGSL